MRDPTQDHLLNSSSHPIMPAIQPKPLTTQQVARIDHLQQLLAKVYPCDLSTWTQQIASAIHPEHELHVWESIAEAYRTFCQRHALTALGHQEVFRLLHLRSAGISGADLIHQVAPTNLTDMQLAEVLELTN